MKNYYFFIFLALFAICSHTILGQQKEYYLFSYFVENGQDGLHLAYSEDGLDWKALNGEKSFLKPEINSKLMRDPCIILGNDGLYHMVWTTGWNDKTIGYASSKDLQHWSQQKTIPVMEHEPTAKNSWAPEIVYNDKKKEYLIFWATTIPNRHDYVAESQYEKGLNHRIYYTKTKDFKKFSKTKLFFNPDFSVIDASILKDGEAYLMFLKNENPNPAQKNIRFVSSKNIEKFPTIVSESITGKYWAEGPSGIRIGEYIYVYFDKYLQSKYGVVRSKDLTNWEDVSKLAQFPKGAKHGSVLKITEKAFGLLVQDYMIRD